MKILLQNTLYDPYLIGGAERSVQFLAEGLAEKGHVVNIVTIGETSQTDNVNGIMVHRTRPRNVYWIYKGGWRFLKPIWHILDRYNPAAGYDIRKILEKTQPDVLHTNNLAGVSISAWSEAKKLGIPIVHTLRDYYLLCPSSTMFRDGQNCDKPCKLCSIWATRRIKESKEVSSVVGNSQKILNTHLNNGGFERSKIRDVIYSAYPAPVKTRTNSIVSRPSPDGSLIVGYLGQILPSKGVIELIRSVNATKREITLLIGGTGNEVFLEVIKKEAGSSVQFLGRVEPSDFFQRIDVLVVPSLWEEPLPRVAIEAHCFGIPVIATNRGGTPEIIDHNHSGWIVDSLKIEQELRGLFETISPEECQRMSDACFSSSKRFTPQFVAEKYEKVFASTVQNYQSEL